ncbi:MAG TPA: helix-turn-helix domain-containing protein [Myxococcota bacterium]|nr:helix-turn-helix domain-containing protein [Myxococcota bacterium]
MTTAVQERGKRRARSAPENVLAAAFTCFSRYGYRRVSLEQIAQEAGVSRAALYLHFANKEDIFRAVSGQVHERAQQAAEAAAGTKGRVEQRIAAVLDAKYGKFYEIIHDSPHVSELLEERNRLCGDVSETYRKRFLRTLRSVLEDAERAGELDLSASGLDAGDAAELFVDSAKGLEMSGAAPQNPARYRRRVARLIGVLAKGLAAPAPRRARRG